MNEPTPTKDTLPPDVLQGLAMQWMEAFQKAAITECRPAILQLFSESGLICGAQKSGPLDHILSKQFGFEVEKARMIPLTGHVLVVCPWTAPSPVVGGTARNGDSTFFLGVEDLPQGKHRFVCYHAHFSLINAP